MSKKSKIRVIHSEMVSDNCRLVVTKEGWHIEYDAFTYEEGKDMKYKVTSGKIPQYLADLRDNLKLFRNIMQDKRKSTPYDVEGLRDMLIRTRGDRPGVYLTDRFLIMEDERDYEEIEAALMRAKEIAEQVLEKQV